MAESTKLRSLREIRENLVARRYSDAELNTLRLADTDGRMVRFADVDILDAVDRRIAAEEAA